MIFFLFVLNNSSKNLLLLVLSSPAAKINLQNIRKPEV